MSGDLLSLNSEQETQILHVITSIDRGGAENQLLMMLRSSQEHACKHTVVYLKGHSELLPEFSGLPNTRVLDLSQKTFFKQYLSIQRLIFDNKFSIIFAHLPRSEFLTCLLINSSPIVLVKHNAETFFPRASSSLMRLVSRLFSRLVEFKSTNVVCISSSVLNYLKLKKEVGLEEKYKIIHYGIPSGFGVPVNSILRKKAPASLIFGSLGRLVPQKNYAFLINAFDSHFAHINRSRLIIYGQGHEEQKLTNLINNQQSRNSILLAGRTKNLVEAYGSFDIFVLASKYEGFGLVILEAISFGLPVICSRIPVFEEILGKDYLGFFSLDDVNELSNLMHLSYDLSFREELVSKSQSALTRFTIFASLNKYVELIMEAN